MTNIGGQELGFFGLGEDDVSDITAGYGQAMADILSTAQVVFGQAQTYIKRTNQVSFGQAQAWVKVTRQGYGQAQVLIDSKRVFGQAQGDIKAVSQAYAQAQAKLNAFGVQAYGQAMASIHTDGQGQGNAQAAILGFTDNFADAFTFGFTQGIYVINQDLSSFTSEGFEPFPGSGAGFPTDGSISGVPTGWIRFTLDSEYITNINTFQFNDLDASHDTILGLYTGVSGPGSWEVVQYPLGYDDDAAGSVESQITLLLPAGDYYLQLLGQNPSVLGALVTFDFEPNTQYTFGQAQAKIFALPIITRRAFGQASWSINSIIKQGFGQAQAQIKFPQNVEFGFANAYIKSEGNFGFGQAMALRAERRSGYSQAQAQIIASQDSSAAIALWRSKGPIPRYLAKYNSYRMPGYVQNESFNNVNRVVQHASVYADGSLSEYTGLDNKQITVKFKVWEEDYQTCKNEISKAASIVRSRKQGYAPLYIQYSDRHYDALGKTIRVEGTAGQSVKTLGYEVDFETRPWLIADTLNTLTGTGSLDTNQVARSFNDGTWTPTQIKVSGTDITISGHTDTGLYTGFVSIAGTVSNMLIDSDAVTATVAGINNNERMLWPDYRIFVGPGRTLFDVYGATDITITYNNRWPL